MPTDSSRKQSECICSGQSYSKTTVLNNQIEIYSTRVIVYITVIVKSYKFILKKYKKCLTTQIKYNQSFLCFSILCISKFAAKKQQKKNNTKLHLIMAVNLPRA